MDQGTRDPAVGEEITTFSCKTREMTSLCTSRRRQPCLLRAGADQDGLLDVAESRTSPLHHPESHRLATPFSRILQKISVLDASVIFSQKHNFAEKFGWFHNLSPEAQLFFYLRENVSGTFSAAFQSSNKNLNFRLKPCIEVFLRTKDNTLICRSIK